MKNRAIWIFGFLLLVCTRVETKAQNRIRITSPILYQGSEASISLPMTLKIWNPRGELIHQITLPQGQERKNEIEISLPSSLPSSFFISLETDRTLPVFSRILTAMPELVLSARDFLTDPLPGNAIILIPGDVAKQDFLPEINALDYFLVYSKMGQSCQCPEDLNLDGVVDAKDVEIVANGNDELKRSLIPKP